MRRNNSSSAALNRSATAGRSSLGYSVVYWAPSEMHCNNLGLLFGLGLFRVMVISSVRVRIGVKVRLVLWLGLALEVRTSRVVKAPWGIPYFSISAQ